MQKALRKNPTIGPTAGKAAVMLMKHELTQTETNMRTFLNLSNAFAPLGSPAERTNLSRNISHFTAPSHFGQQASIGMFLVSF